MGASSSYTSLVSKAMTTPGQFLQGREERGEQDETYHLETWILTLLPQVLPSGCTRGMEKTGDRAGEVPEHREERGRVSGIRCI